MCISISLVVLAHHRLRRGRHLGQPDRRRCFYSAAAESEAAAVGGDPARQRGSEARVVVAVIVVEDERGSWTQVEGGRSPVAMRTARQRRRARSGGCIAADLRRGEERRGEGEFGERLVRVRFEGEAPA